MSRPWRLSKAGALLASVYLVILVLAYWLSSDNYWAIVPLAWLTMPTIWLVDKCHPDLLLWFDDILPLMAVFQASLLYLAGWGIERLCRTIAFTLAPRPHDR